ncbi:unnamed protein product [Urochloa humidicola]
MENATSSTAAQEQDWSSLPADLLKTILDLLPWSNHPKFTAACKAWRSVVSPFYPAWLTPVLFNVADVGATNSRYYSPYYHKNFEVSTTAEALNAKLCCANGHRLTLYQRAGEELTVVDADLVTGDICNLNPLESPSFDFVVSNGAQRMLGVDTFCTLRIGRTIKSDDDGSWHDWELPEFDPEGPELQVSPTTNPVFHRGLLYLLGVDGRLAVYDDNRNEEGFQLLDMPKGFGFECDDCYLFDSDQGELMAMLMGSRGPPVHVVKLNEQSMEWEEVESLEGRTLFTGTLTTTMVKIEIKWMQNKIFIPRLYDWPETIHVDLVNREGELAFVPISVAAPQTSGACGRSVWTCELGRQEALEFWETIKVDYSIWVDFSK